jgi:hypothetical protein
MAASFANFGFLTFGANDSLTILGAEGLKTVNIYNPSTSTGNCTVTGKSGFTIGGRACGSIAITPGSPPFTISSDVTDENSEDIDQVTIATAVGCTVLISGLKKTYN